MKIAVEAQILVKGNRTGIPWTLHNVLEEFRNDENEYTLNYFGLGLSSEERERMSAYERDNIKSRCVKYFHNGIYRRLWEHLDIPYTLFFGCGADVTLFFNYLVPKGVAGKKVNLVCDMGYKSCPETLRDATRKELENYLGDSCKRSDLVLTISEFSKSEIVRFLDIAPEKVKVIPLGADTELYRRVEDKDRIKACKKKYGISGKYFLYLGTIEPRKNLERLIMAYASIAEQGNDIPKLVLAGGKGWKNEAIYDAARKKGLEGKVIFTGYVDLKDAPTLMTAAELFLFPSIYEGFGLPPLEAMACGTPTLVSDAASLPEVVGDASIMVDPHSMESIAEGMEFFLSPKCDREEYVAKGYQRLEKYSWKKCASKIKEYVHGL